MREAYEQTIEDFRIELMNCNPFDWEHMSFCQDQIEYYEKKLKETE